jgi:hypothetical protein
MPEESGTNAAQRMPVAGSQKLDFFVKTRTKFFNTQSTELLEKGA